MSPEELRQATVAETTAFLQSLRLPDGTALTATGSLARGEMTPHSDVDLVLLHQANREQETSSADFSAVWYPVWDAKIRLDHAVRTPQECAQLMATEPTAALALLDVCHIEGDPQLTAHAQEAVRHQWRRVLPKMFNTVVSTAIARWRRSGSVVDMTRPDIKHGRGGLRDIELLRALALGNVCDAPPLSHQHRLLLDVRTLLHVEAHRARDVLDPEFAMEVALQLGFEDRYDLSRALADAAHTVDSALTTALTQARRLLGHRSPSRQRRPLDVDVVDGGGQVQLSRDPDLEDPCLLLRVTAAAARHQLPVSSYTWRQLHHTPPLPVPWPAAATSDFFTLLGSPEVVSDMDRHGLWTRLVPSWDHVRGRMPRESTHIHTIDVHLLNTVAGCAQSSVKVSRPDLLLLAALFHDLGKGYGRPHAQVGAEMVVRMAATMGLNLRDRMCVQTLVAEHTLLSRLAARYDLGDEEGVDTLLDAVHYDPLTLELLQHLTEADARATGPGVWTAWLDYATTSLVAVARRRLTTPHPVKPLVAVPGDSDISISADERKIYWRGPEGDNTRILALIAAKGWNIVHTKIDTTAHADTQWQAEFSVRGRGLDHLNQEEFVQAYKSNVFTTIPEATPAATATYWFGAILEVRTIDRPGVLAVLIATLPPFRWCTVDVPGTTMIARFHLTGSFDRAVVERNVTRALATG